VAQNGQDAGIRKLSGQTVVGELIRNMELGRFELAYSVLLPCVFSVYLHPEDHARLGGVFPLITEDARRALRSRVIELNGRKSLLGLKLGGKSKEFKIACNDWIIEFLANNEVPVGDIEIHSELNETAEPGFRGTKTTLIDREPSVTSQRTQTIHAETRKSADRVFAEIHYEDDSGPQLYLVTQNEVSVGRGGDGQLMDLALYAPDDVSREHLNLRRDPASGAFTLRDKSTNGTWLNGKRLKRGEDEPLADAAEISLAEVLTLSFRLRK
jgi:hypothetical protein